MTIIFMLLVCAPSWSLSEDYQRLASLAVESGPTIPTADESSSDSDDDAESTRQKLPPPEVRAIVGTLAVFQARDLGSHLTTQISWWLH